MERIFNSAEVASMLWGLLWAQIHKRSKETEIQHVASFYFQFLLATSGELERPFEKSLPIQTKR